MRYVFDSGCEHCERLQYDVLIIGAGIAGLYTALNIDENYSCCILTKESVEISNSWLAQGGIAAAISTDDTPALHYDDTLEAGAGLCDKEAVKVLVEEGPCDVRSLVSMSVPFDLNSEGDLEITREGGHRKNRIVHAGGDATGKETVKSLARLVAMCSNVSFMGHSFFVDVVTDETGAVTGAIILDQKEKRKLIECGNVVIATGGIGQVYQCSTNPSVATGDGLAAAMRAGARIKGIEFIQFHPTGLWSERDESRAFLISEAVRGEGGLLKNKAGERFMETQHELGELAPRDIVARGIVREMQRTGDDHVYIDITSRTRDFLSRRFPTIYHECLRRDIDISREWIPVCPVQHYLIGGIETDLHGQTNLEGLFACGEAAATGVHGANRLASNSMLECLVFGRRAARRINERLFQPMQEPRLVLPEAQSRPPCPGNFGATREEIAQLMNDHCGVIRNKAGMEKALDRVEELLRGLERCFNPGRPYVETLNIAMVARAILRAALARAGSVGAHYRED